MQEKSIEKDEEILNNIKAYMQENIDKGYHKFVYNDLGCHEKCIDIINAIETVLSELEKKDKEYEELTEASKELCKTVNLMKKVINEMAEYIIDLIKYNNSEEERDKEEIKEYFTKKAEKGE